MHLCKKKRGIDFQMYNQFLAESPLGQDVVLSQMSLYL